MIPLTTKPLASERVRAGLTQEEAAAALGCSAKSLCFYENDVRPMPPDFVNEAANLFGCSTDYLYKRTDERLPSEVGALRDEREAS